MADLPPDLVTLLAGAAPCFVATVDPDGSPQLTQTWVDTDGAHVVINTPGHTRKLANLRRDPRVTVDVCEPADLSRYWVLKGRVVEITTDGADAHIEELSQRYTGGPYQNYGGRRGDRTIVRIAVDRVAQKPW